MTEHIDIEVLADHAEGLLSDEETARVTRHLAECERCAEEYAALSDVSVVLSSLPPPAMPSDVATRIERAISAEARARQQEAPAADGPANVVPLRPRRRRWIAPLTAAAAAVIVVGGGFAVVKQLGAPSGSSNGASRGQTDTTKPSRALPDVPVPDLMRSDTDYTPSSLATQVNALVKKSSSSGLSPKSSRDKQPSSPLPSDIAGCVTRIAAKVGFRPIVVDRATYEGQKVKVLVFRKAPSAKTYDVWIVGPHCSGSADGLVTRTTVPRHG